VECPAPGAAGLRGRNPRPAAGPTALLNQIIEAETRGPVALFTLLIKPGLPLPEDELRTACLNLLPAIPEYLKQFNRRFEPLTVLEHNRVLALGAESRDDWRRAQNYWDGVVGALSQQQTPDALLARAAVLRHLADLAQKHPEMHGGPWTDPVTGYLERSLEADPDHLPATLALIEQYRTADSPKDWHRATDLAAKRFPGNTAILLQAVDSAVARSAYKKARFRSACADLDPINQPVRQRMIELQLRAQPDAEWSRDPRERRWRGGGEERADAPSAPLDQPGSRRDAWRSEPASGRRLRKPTSSPAAGPPAGSVRNSRPR
jgi:hypothetical protein